MPPKAKGKNTSDSSLTDQARSLVENSLQNTSANTSRNSTGRKRSLYLSDVDVEVEGPKDCHIQEKEERRLQEAAKRHLDLQEKEIQRDKKVQRDPLLNTLTSEELNQHYYHCVNLFTKNKVTSQNAFKLQLIDYMEMMVVDKNEKAENLALMSCTLDASAKIYACRVDKVYNDMVKHLSANLTGEDGENEAPKERRSRKRNKDSRGDQSDDEEDETGGKRLKKHSIPKTFKFLKKKGSFERKVEQVFYGANLPGGQSYFMQFPVSSSGAQLVMSKPLIENEASDIKSSDEFVSFDRYTGGCDNDRLTERIPGYSDLRSKMVVIDDASEKSQVIENSFTYDPEAAELAAQMDAPENRSDDENDADAHNDVDYDEAETVPTATDETPFSNTVSSITSGSGRPMVCLTPAALTRFLRPAALESTQSSEQSFFDDSKLEFLAGASHWKIKPSRQQASTGTKTPRTETKSRSQLVLNLSEEYCQTSLQALMDVDGISAKKLLIKTISEWRHKIKNTFPKEIMFSHKDLWSTFKNKIPFKLHTKGTTPDDYAEEEDGEMFTQDDFTALRDDGDDMDDGFAPLDVEPTAENEEAAPPAEDNKSNVDLSVDELLQPKVQVEKNTIQFNKIQKRVDMKELKATMWSLMALEDEKENTINNPTENTKKKTSFTHLVNQLPKRLSEPMASNVSVHLAFLSMLFLANEKCLRLESSGTDDIDVMLD